MDFDLRGVYCMPVVQQNIKVINEALSAENDARARSLAGPLKRELQAETETMRRLTIFNDSKRSVLDPVAAARASEQGTRDVTYRLNQLADVCDAKCAASSSPNTILACYKTCADADETNQRINRNCGDLSWLPH
jgi:hypothetical protein